MQSSGFITEHYVSIRQANQEGKRAGTKVGKEVQGTEFLWHIKLVVMLWKFLQNVILASSAKNIVWSTEKEERVEESFLALSTAQI